METSVSSVSIREPAISRRMLEYFRNEINGPPREWFGRAGDKRPAVLNAMKYQQWEIITRDPRESVISLVRDLTIDKIYIGSRRADVLFIGWRMGGPRNCNFGPVEDGTARGPRFYTIKVEKIG